MKSNNYKLYIGLNLILNKDFNNLIDSTKIYNNFKFGYFYIFGGSSNNLLTHYVFYFSLINDKTVIRSKQFYPRDINDSYVKIEHKKPNYLLPYTIYLNGTTRWYENR